MGPEAGKGASGVVAVPHSDSMNEVRTDRPQTLREETAMEHYAAIDVSLKLSSVCVVDASGKIVHEMKAASDPEALVALFRKLGLPLTRIGLEAGPLSGWLHAGLTAAWFPVIPIKTRHVKAALKAMTAKTGRNGARGMTQLTRMGWFRPIHAKTPPAQEIRAILKARKLLVNKLPRPR